LDGVSGLMLLALAEADLLGHGSQSGMIVRFLQFYTLCIFAHTASANRSIQRTRYMLARLGHLASTHPWRFVAAWVVVVAILAGAVITVGPAFTSNITAPASESSAGLDILTDRFPGAGGDSGSIVFEADRGVTDSEIQSAMTGLFE